MTVERLIDLLTMYPATSQVVTGTQGNYRNGVIQGVIGEDGERLVVIVHETEREPKPNECERVEE